MSWGEVDKVWMDERVLFIFFVFDLLVRLIEWGRE